MNLPLGRQVLGSSPNDVEAFHADRIHNMLHELLPIAVLGHLFVHAQQTVNELREELLG